MFGGLESYALIPADTRSAPGLRSPCRGKVDKAGLMSKKLKLALLEAGTITRIDQCDLTEVPTCIFTKSKLQELHLSRNHLTQLQPDIGNLLQLKVLRLDHNGLVTLPKEVSRLTALQLLDVSHNSLAAVPIELGLLLHLQVLNLWENPLDSSLPELPPATHDAPSRLAATAAAAAGNTYSAAYFGTRGVVPLAGPTKDAQLKKHTGIIQAVLRDLLPLEQVEGLRAALKGRAQAEVLAKLRKAAGLANSEVLEQLKEEAGAVQLQTPEVDHLHTSVHLCQRLQEAAAGADLEVLRAVVSAFEHHVKPARPEGPEYTHAKAAVHRLKRAALAKGWKLTEHTYGPASELVEIPTATANGHHVSDGSVYAAAAAHVGAHPYSSGSPRSPTGLSGSFASSARHSPTRGGSARLKGRPLSTSSTRPLTTASAVSALGYLSSTAMRDRSVGDGGKSDLALRSYERWLEDKKVAAARERAAYLRYKECTLQAEREQRAAKQLEVERLAALEAGWPTREKAMFRHGAFTNGLRLEQTRQTYSRPLTATQHRTHTDPLRVPAKARPQSSPPRSQSQCHSPGHSSRTDSPSRYINSPGAGCGSSSPLRFSRSAPGSRMPSIPNSTHTSRPSTRPSSSRRGSKASVHGHFSNARPQTSAGARPTSAAARMLAADAAHHTVSTPPMHGFGLDGTEKPRPHSGSMLAPVAEASEEIRLSTQASSSSILPAALPPRQSATSLAALYELRPQTRTAVNLVPKAFNDGELDAASVPSLCGIGSIGRATGGDSARASPRAVLSGEASSVGGSSHGGSGEGSEADAAGVATTGTSEVVVGSTAAEVSFSHSTSRPRSASPHEHQAAGFVTAAAADAPLSGVTGSPAEAAAAPLSAQGEASAGPQQDEEEYGDEFDTEEAQVEKGAATQTVTLDGNCSAPRCGTLPEATAHADGARDDALNAEESGQGQEDDYGEGFDTEEAEGEQPPANAETAAVRTAGEASAASTEQADEIKQAALASTTPHEDPSVVAPPITSGDVLGDLILEQELSNPAKATAENVLAEQSASVSVGAADE